jgi:hypothetical protein
MDWPRLSHCCLCDAAIQAAVSHSPAILDKKLWGDRSGGQLPVRGINAPALERSRLNPHQARLWSFGDIGREGSGDRRNTRKRMFAVHPS